MRIAKERLRDSGMGIRSKLKGLLHASREAFDNKEKVHFLHLGKNAGTQIAYIADQINKEGGSVEIILHGHTKKLRSLSPGQRYFFSIRNPEKRFVSGFYSRKRKGQPRIYSEWTPYERLAFERFEHANDLAESLFEDSQRGRDAVCAIKSISHCAMEQINWFDRVGYFLQHNPPVDIIRQEHFDEDIRRFLSKINVAFPIEITEDAVKAHANDYSSIPPLSDKAKRNVFDWYRQDFEFYKLCVDWLENQAR